MPGSARIKKEFPSNTDDSLPGVSAFWPRAGRSTAFWSEFIGGWPRQATRLPGMRFPVMAKERDMRREMTNIRPVHCLAAAAATALVLSLAACGGDSASGASGGSASPASTGAAGHAAAGSSPGDSLALSHMKVLAKLDRSQLCGVLSAAEAARILGAPAAAPAYSRGGGQGITCQWARRGAVGSGADELYVGISTITDWAGAQATDQPLHTSSVKVDGHRALAAAKQATLGWAQVDVALGDDHDPIAEYRAATLARALALATAATPHILAFG
jgi:hypothetical protein